MHSEFIVNMHVIVKKITYKLLKGYIAQYSFIFNYDMKYKKIMYTAAPNLHLLTLHQNHSPPLSLYHC